MSDPKIIGNVRKADFQAWEDAASNDAQTQRERIASEVFLAALGSTRNFKDKVFLKGGILVGAVYESGRNTADLDFSTTAEPTKEFIAELESELIQALPSASAQVGSPDLLIRVQSITYRPRPDTFVEANAPAIEVKFAYAKRGSKQEARFHEGKSADVLYADISFNENIISVEEISIGMTGLSFFAYSKTDLISEKLRSILQQKTRGRNRRQDVYDLWYLIENYEISKEEKEQIRETFLSKCKSRNIEPDALSIADKEVIDRSRSEWDTLENEVEYLPQFEEAFRVVESFYETLW